MYLWQMRLSKQEENIGQCSYCINHLLKKYSDGENEQNDLFQRTSDNP